MERGGEGRWGRRIEEVGRGEEGKRGKERRKAMD